MPYISKAQRDTIDPSLEGILAVVHDLEEGELNYVLSRIVDKWCGPDAGYFQMAHAIAALDCAAREFYRRRLEPYEDNKRLLNGDVYNLPSKTPAPQCKTPPVDRIA